jgi:translocation protein SEC63
VSKALATANKFISRYPNGMSHRTGSMGSFGADGGAAGAAGSGAQDGDDGGEAGQLVEITFMAPIK